MTGAEKATSVMIGYAESAASRAAAAADWPAMLSCRWFNVSSVRKLSLGKACVTAASTASGSPTSARAAATALPVRAAAKSC